MYMYVPNASEADIHVCKFTVESSIDASGRRLAPRVGTPSHCVYTTAYRATHFTPPTADEQPPLS